MTVTFHDLTSAMRKAGLNRQVPVIAHASLSAFGEVRGGSDTMLGALLASSAGLMMPTFTFKTMLIPETGPEANGIQYGAGKDLNRMAEFFTPDMPADPLMGSLAEQLRQNPRACRSSHPILSFAGIGLDDLLEMQTLSDPLAPIAGLAEREGWVVLLGVDHTVNTSIHFAEGLAGRRSFTRWALTPEGVRECPAYPGCSDGFDALAPNLAGVVQTVAVGDTRIQALPLVDLFRVVVELLESDPLALLCGRDECERCDTHRAALEQEP